ncbi:PIN domain-like protein [Eremomyces bilateralis CBS 781.70]|uniref:PIN domain-like protein n=1 Tax=Eremomyces bilateralis CBS 781.70 TaxID=1392243 RepID=A0A6G1FYB3_9PEZI|nr:PIN domain-like protein [Eremomyces bilateralis CBS 781.70]KAF1810855.1 PIN domain-like protein [Eremomyces bilateralis CBS 781.70]
MGIPGLWDVLGGGQIVSLAEYSANHFQKTGKPLRIAIDEPTFRFRNLTPAQVKTIKDKVPAANPIEKAILDIVFRLLRWNIECVFVFDGPSRPWKRGRPSGMPHYEEQRLLKELLRYMRVPICEAPGEAEAECAALQSTGIVDAVWTDDGDAFMFGCTTLIRFCKEVDVKTGKEVKRRKNQGRDEELDNAEGAGAHNASKGKASQGKSRTHVRIYTQEDLQKGGLDRAGVTAFAVLSGADYDTKGITDCGPRKALQAARAGLGASLVQCPLTQLHMWRKEVVDFFPGLRVELDWPNSRHVGHYRNPKVGSAEDHARVGAYLDGMLKKRFDLEALRRFLAGRFNLWTKGFMENICPIILTRSLVQTEPDQRAANRVFNITIKRRRKVNGEYPQSAEIKVTYSPLSVMPSINLKQKWERASDSTMAQKKFEEENNRDHTQPLECELLDRVLRHGLPADIFEQPEKPKQSRKRKSVDGEGSEEPANKPKRGRPPKKSPAPTTDTVPSEPALFSTPRGETREETVSRGPPSASAARAPARRPVFIPPPIFHDPFPQG